MLATARPWLLLALRRMGDERALVGAAFLVALVATTVAAACAVYPDLTTRRGLIAVLRGADPAATAVTVTADVAPASTAETDASVTDAVQAALGAGAGTLSRTMRSESWQLPGGRDPAHPPLTMFAWDEGIQARTTLVAGSWPTGAATASGAVDAAVTTGAAASLGVGPGSTIEVTSRLDAGRRLVVRIVGVVKVTDASDPAWGGDRLAVDGAAQPGSFPLRGPLYVSREALPGTVVARATLTWRAAPAFERIGPDDVASIRAGVAGLPGQLAARLGSEARLNVTTDLAATLGAAGAGVTSGSGGTAIVALQLLLLAAYAIVLLASLVVDQRRAASELAAARGAPGAALLGLAALEGVLIALPAVLLGPLLAVGFVGALAGGGGAGEPGPRLTTTAAGLALAAGIAVVAGMVLPTTASLGPVVRLRGALAGRASRGMAERTGIDVALLVLAALAFWQLRENGTPLQRAAAGTGGVDPLLAAAPAIGLLAGGLLALRAGPLVGSWLERPAGGAAGTVGPMAARGIARRSAEAGRASLLVVVAVGIVLFTAAYARTWAQSQRDQVAAAIPAELTARAVARPDAPPPWVTRDALLALPGVGEALPAVRQSFAVGNAVTRGVLLAVPATAARGMVEVRGDLADAPFDELLGQLAAGRPAVPVVAVPPGATALRVTLDADLAAVPVADGTGAPLAATWGGLSPVIVVRDGLGDLYRLPVATGRVTGGRQQLEATLVASDGSQAARLAEPVEVVAVQADLALPDTVAVAGTLRLDKLTAIVDRAGSPAEVPLDLAPARAGWAAARGTFGAAPAPLASSGDPLAAVLDQPVVGPVPATVRFGPANAAAVAGATIPGVIDGSTRDAVGLAVGDVVPIQLGIDTVVRVRIAGIVDVLPGIPPGSGGMLADLPTMALLDDARDGTSAAPTDWWLGPAPGTASLAAAAPAAAGLGLVDIQVRSTAVPARLDDPLAQGMQGALDLAAAAALLFGVVGFAAAAWRSARVRGPELAVALALGVERRSSAAWLGLELAFQLLVGIGGGIVLGLALSWAVLPSVTLTPDGSPAVPAPIVVLPWDLVAAVAALGVAAFLALLVPLRRLGRDEHLAADLREVAA